MQVCSKINFEKAEPPISREPEVLLLLRGVGEWDSRGGGKEQGKVFRGEATITTPVPCDKLRKSNLKWTSGKWCQSFRKDASQASERQISY